MCLRDTPTQKQMSSIIQRTNGRYQASVMVNGKRFRKDFKAQPDALEWAAQQEIVKPPKEVKVIEPVHDNVTPHTWGHLFSSVYYRVWKGTKGEKTAVLNGSAVVDFFCPELEFKNVTLGDVDAFVADLVAKGNQGSTINRKLAALSKMLRFAHSRGWITTLPVIERKAEPFHRIRFLTDEEEASLLRLMGAKSPYLAELCLFLVDTGCRVSEALRLTWADVNWSQSLVTFWDTKGGGSRSIPMTKRVKEMMIDRNALVDALFPFEVKQSSLNAKWTQVQQEMGLQDDADFVPHALRHTCASRLVQRNIPILTVREWLGHKTLAVTLRYAHLAPQQLVEAVKVLEPQT